MTLQHVGRTTTPGIENEVESSAMHCVSCGRNVNGSWKFCAHCDTKSRWNSVRQTGHPRAGGWSARFASKASESRADSNRIGA